MGDDTMIMMAPHSDIKKTNISLIQRFISILGIVSLMYISMISMNRDTDVLQIKDFFASMKSHTNRRRRLQTTNNKSAQRINNDQKYAMPNGKSMKKKNKIRKNQMKIALSNNNEYNNTIIIPKAFTSWPINKELPCYPPEDDWYRMYIQNTKPNEGLFYLKPYKTGSSTSSGIHLRISRNIAKRQNIISTYNDMKNETTQVCKSRFDHGPTFCPGNTLYKNRNKERSILWTVIREPTHRAVSAFFHFAVSRRNVDANNITNFIDFLENRFPKDYYLHALYTDHIYTRGLYNPIEISNIILNEYNFIGITERMDESAVVLMMLMNLKLADILYLSAKTHGGYDDAGGGHGCTLIQPSFVSTEMKEYIDSEQWYDYIKYDLKFYQAVNTSLELTIDYLGREEFNKNLQKFINAKKYAIEKCLSNAIFPCDNNGKYHLPTQTDCLWKDSGCGATCLDDVANELNLW